MPITNQAAPWPVWAEIDTEAIRHNLGVVRGLVGPSCQIMAVVKADGYGHGSVRVARIAAESGASAFGVARLAEALTLREAGFTQPILVFGYTPPSHAGLLVEKDIIQTVFSRSYGEELHYHAGGSGKRVRVHLKSDSGMGRLGIPFCRADDEPSLAASIDAIRGLVNLPNIQVEWIYTHVAASDSPDKSSARGQLAAFNRLTSALDAEGIRIPLKHAANSAAVMGVSGAHLDMVRPGIMMYGLSPSGKPEDDAASLKPAMQIKVRIAQVKNVPKGFHVSYGHTYTTPQPTRLATIPIGYGDGYNRNLSSCGTVLAGGKRAPIVGRICMDQTIVDVGHIPGVSEGDEAVIIGQQGAETITADEIASQLGTINYEIVTGILARVPRMEA